MKVPNKGIRQLLTAHPQWRATATGKTHWRLVGPTALPGLQNGGGFSTKAVITLPLRQRRKPSKKGLPPATLLS